MSTLNELHGAPLTLPASIPQYPGSNYGAGFQAPRPNSPGMVVSPSTPTLAVADADAMQAVIDAGTVEIGQLFRLGSDGTLRRYEGGGKASLVTTSEKPEKSVRMTSMKASSISVKVMHDGELGASGVCYSVEGGTPVYTAIAANTLATLSIPHKSGALFTFHIWPAAAVSSHMSEAKGNLTRIEVNSNHLTALDVSGLTALGYLNCNSNRLTSLDLSGSTAMSYFSCTGNRLTSLDLSGLTALQQVYCSSNRLTSLDVSGLTGLVTLNCSGNRLTSLDVSGLTALTHLVCTDNQLTSVSLSGAVKVGSLSLDGNHLTSLDLSGLTLLVSLQLANNQLTSLDVPGPMELLSFIRCNNNQLTTLDVSGLTALSRLDCAGNQLTYLSVGPGPFSILDASLNPALSTLTVPDNFDAHGGYSMGSHHLYSLGGVVLYGTGLSGSALNALYQKLIETPEQGDYGAGYIYLKNPLNPSLNPCAGWDSDDPSLAPAAWTIYGT